MIIRGRVINEKTNEPAAGIPVSDGRSTVLTDAEGRYTIELWEKAKLVYVCALTHGHDDWYIHLQSGREEYNFICCFAEVSGDFSFFHNSDIEIESRPECDFNDFMRKEVRDHKPAFFMHGGDLCRDAGLRRTYLIMNRETVGCPVRFCIGNHDFRGDDWGESVFERYYGPTYYSFDCGDVHFVVLSLLQGDKKPLYTNGDQQLWLKSDLELLAKGKKVFVFSHTWVDNYEWTADSEPRNPHVNLMDYSYLGCAVGHHHVNFLHKEGDTFYICTSRPDSGGIDSSAAGIRRVDFTEGEISSRMIYFTKPTEPCTEFVWESKISGNVEHCAPLVEDGVVYVATNDLGYPKSCGIYALDLDTGAIIWQTPTEDGIRGGIVKLGDTLFCQTTVGELLYVSAKDGKIFKTVTACKSPTYFNSSTPLIFNGRITVGKQMPFSAVSIEDGSVLWTASTIRPSSTPALALYDSDNNLIITGVNWTGTYGVNADTGEIVWEQREGRAVCFYSSTPLLSDGVLYNAGLYSVCKQNPADGSILASAGTGGARMDSTGAPAEDDSTLYYPTGNMGVIAIDKQTLERRAIYPAGVNALYTTPYICGNSLQTVEGSPILMGDTLIFADNAGTLRFYDKTTAELKKCISLGEPTTASLAVADGHLIACGHFGSIKKIKL